MSSICTNLKYAPEMVNYLIAKIDFRFTVNPKFI